MKRRSEERLSARKYIQQVCEAGVASRYIRQFKIRPGDRVYLALRVSGSERRLNLLDERKNLRHQVKRKGGIVVGAYRHIGSGFDTGWVGRAAIKARRRGATIVLAETTDRFVRNELFHSIDNPDAQATEDELKGLVADAGGMTLMTHLHPDASPKEVRSYQRKRGQKYKGRKGGRPKKRHYRQRFANWSKATKAEIKRLHDEGGSIRDIAEIFKVSKSALHRYLRQLPKLRLYDPQAD